MIRMKKSGVKLNANMSCPVLPPSILLFYIKEGLYHFLNAVALTLCLSDSMLMG